MNQRGERRLGILILIAVCWLLGTGADPALAADPVVTFPQAMALNARQAADLSAGPMAEESSRTFATTAECRRMLARLRREARRLEGPADDEQYIAFSSRDHLQVEAAWQGRRLIRVAQCEGPTLSIGDHFDSPNIPPPEPPPPPPRPPR